MGDPVALESRPLGRTIGAHCPRTEAGYCTSSRVANQVEAFLAGHLEAQPSRASQTPMGGPTPCATRLEPQARTGEPWRPVSGSPALPRSPAGGHATPRDRRPPNRAASAAFASAQRVEKLRARPDVTLDCFEESLDTDEPPRDSTAVPRAATGRSSPASLAGYPPCGWCPERLGPGDPGAGREAIDAAI
jgi:hypothetical protein